MALERQWQAAARLVEILAYLHSRGDVGSDAAKAAFKVADSASVKKWERDLEELRRRGLIITDLPPNRTGIRAITFPKKKDWFLTSAEHDALQAARRALPTVVMPRARPRLDGDDYQVFDRLTAIIRLLEESSDCGEPLAVRDIATRLGMSSGELVFVLRLLDDDGLPERRGLRSGLAGVEVHAGADGEDWGDATVEDPEDFEVLLSRPEGPRTTYRTEHRGLGLIGGFAYSLEETQDRLDLIDGALAGNLVCEDDQAHLKSARGKLGNWRHVLSLSLERMQA